MRFYHDTLGFPVIFQQPNMALLACGDTRVLLGTPEQNPTKQLAFLYFAVNDIQRTNASWRPKA